MSTPPSLPRRRLPAILLALLIGACSPVYERSYRLEPPAQPSDATQQCLAQCTMAQNACLVPANAQLQNCDAMASLAQDQCRNQAQIDYMICQQAYSSEGINCSYRVCDRPICAPTAVRDCEADYRRCFAGCGGRVVEEPRCVANCPS